MSKVKSLKSAVEACISIMRIDTMIKLDREWPFRCCVRAGGWEGAD